MILLLEAVVRALALAIVTGALLWMLRVKNVSAQRTAWTMVLVAAFAMPALMRSPWIPAPLQWKPSIPTQHTTTLIPLAPTVAHGSLIGPGARVLSTPASSQPLPPIERKAAWRLTPSFFFAIYGAIAGILALRLLFGVVSAIRLWRRASPVSNFAAVGLAVRMSGGVTSPVTIGSGIVLPANYAEWSQEKLRAVLAHERAHVRNFDFYLQLLAAFYAAIFWISPLGWFLRRRLAVLAEAISDQAGILEAGTRSGYAEIVLHFAAMPRRPMTGVAMACTGNLTRRIEQLLNEDLYRAAFSRGRTRARIAFLLVTFAVFTTSALLRVPNARAAQPAPAPPHAVPAQIAEPAPPAPAAVALAALVPPPQAVTQSSKPQSNGEHTRYSYGFSDDGDSYALVDGNSRNMTFSGHWDSDDSHAEIDKARRAANNGTFFWFHHNGKSYIVTDPTIVANLKALYAPMEELGRQQEELGKKQEALGRQQEELGRKQELAGVPTPDMSREIAELNAAISKLQAMKGKEMTSEQLGEIQEKLGDLQGKIGDIQGKIGEKQGTLGEEQGRLGEEQGKLGDQQGKLGEQQGKLAEAADKQVKTVIQEVLSNGKAKPVE